MFSSSEHPKPVSACKAVRGHGPAAHPGAQATSVRHSTSSAVGLKPGERRADRPHPWSCSVHRRTRLGTTHPAPRGRLPGDGSAPREYLRENPVLWQNTKAVQPKHPSELKPPESGGSSALFSRFRPIATMSEVGAKDWTCHTSPPAAPNASEFGTNAARNSCAFS